jgi:hypothetical protein
MNKIGQKKQEVQAYPCPLCAGKSDPFQQFRKKQYLTCSKCYSIFLHRDHFLSPLEEEARYLKHNHDVENPNYQNFVLPLVELVTKRFSPAHKGLDFGAGKGPIVSKLLSDKNFRMNQFDLYFWNDPQVLDESYDFIVCSEVIEHFRNPIEEFSKLRKLLKEGGALYCMTSIFEESIDFEKWYYKDDPTHVFFYHTKAIKWIRDYFQYKEVSISKNLITFFS